MLSSRPDLSREDMEDLQLDTESRYHAMVLSWVVDHGAPATPAQEAIVARWRAWDGMAYAQGETFAEALDVTRALYELLLAQVRVQLLPASVRELRYSWRMQDAWLIATLQSEGGMAVFGLDSAEVANYLLEVAVRPRQRHVKRNRWQAQHPFVGRIPIVGDLFRVDEYLQWGFSSLVRVERPRFGASLRFVFDLSDPAESTWITPVGQSGHPGSSHDRDLQPLWHGAKRLKVLATGHDWGL